MVGAVDALWLFLGGTLVFFMQAGFAMVETGFTRAKNAGNITMKNFVDFMLGSIVYWLIGYGLMWGDSIGGFIGKPALFMNGLSADCDYTSLFFQTVFCATAATIVSGAMAERTKFKAYVLYSFLISLFIYPVAGHWVWGGGFLGNLGFHDFAGSAIVHMLGGTIAFVGAAVLGPRIGKYGKNGKVNAIPGHNIVIGALGVLILWFGWFGFNPASTGGLSDGRYLTAAKVFITTNLAACVAAATAMFFTWAKYGKPDVSLTLNGVLAGLVAITAPCDAVTPVGAIIIGIVAGFLMVFVVEFLDKKLKVDDPVGAVAVHGSCGLWGTISVGLFAAENTESLGLFYGGGVHQLLVQLLGAVCLIAWAAILAFIMFKVIKATIGLRASREEEVTGLDLTEHGLASAYAGFTTSLTSEE
ncbi:MAG: ammonium transporter [Clostridia bacterium]|nr:ammonium transporter [Clostridia bacterium]